MSLRTQEPTREQLGRIEELSEVVLGSRLRLFEEVGVPETRWEASQMLGAMHKVRNKTAGGTEAERTLIRQIEEIPDMPKVTHTPPEAKQEEEPVTATETTKTCSSCDENKPLSEFAKQKSAADGLDYRCRDCKRKHNREYYRKNDAINFAIKIIHDGIYHEDVQVVDNRIGTTHLANS